MRVVISPDGGSYPYTGTGYANPDAVTQIANGLGNTTFAYDNAGDETSAGSSTFTWDWRNHLNTSVIAATTSIYSYDENDHRVRIDDGLTIFHYPNDLYQTDSLSGLPTKHVQLNGRDIAVITGPTGSSTVTYSFGDNQNSTTVVTDTSSNVKQSLDYFPYGSLRINSGSDVSQRKYIGQFTDPTNIDYFNARYYEGSRGQFLSQDPMFLSNPKGQNLFDPQSLNSYSYSEDNPITKSDPTGKASYIWANGAGMTGIDTWNTGTYYQTTDYAMLNADAAQMHAQGPVGGLYNFTTLNWPGSAWDYKARANSVSGGREFYFFGDQLVSADTYGNYHYGYVGTAAGYSPSVLQSGAGFAQVVRALGNLQIPNLNWAGSYFNNPINTPKS